MNRPQLFIVSNIQAISSPTSLEEKIEDHNAILQGYIDTHITRNHSNRTTDSEARFLTGWFEKCMIQDDSHPDGARQLFIWEAMAPVTGRQRIQGFAKGLVAELKCPSTVRGYLGGLRRCFEYVLEFPYIPGREGSLIPSKYGRIEQPVTKYDYPVHSHDLEAEGYPLVGDDLLNFYDFVRTDYLKKNQKVTTASRDYSMIVTVGEGGFRANEVCMLDAFGEHRDLFYERGRIQTRFGKASNGSGARPRKTIFTPFAQETMRVYVENIRPHFRNATSNPALFLSEVGKRISYQSMHRGLRSIAIAAQKAGIDLPPDFGWHSLRRSFATNYCEQNPDQIWVLMDMLGHSSPNTLRRYVRHNRAYYDKAIDNVLNKLMGDCAQAGKKANDDYLEAQKVAGG